MFFECTNCGSFADDGDILNHVCLTCLENMNISPSCASTVTVDTDCNNSNSDLL